MEYPKFIIFEGKKYRLSGSYYRSDNWGKRKPNLHRAIWEHYNKRKIPDGYHVHHKDGNSFNNDISNLELIFGFEHLSEHAKQKWKDNPEIYRGGLKKAIAAARKWHKSDEGRAWHSQQIQQTWKKILPV